MYLRTLALKNFRNFESLQLEFAPQVNIFTGRNAQGKTNLLEAIYFLALTRSQRTSSERELIRFGEKFASLKGEEVANHLLINLRLVISAQGKRAWINERQQQKLSNYVGQLNAVLFSPEDLELVKGAPALRRRFMDLEFGQISPDYLYYASQYRQVLQQRNNYLKQLQQGESHDEVFLNVLSDQLAGIAAELVRRRFDFVAQLDQYASAAHAAISATGEKLQIEYAPALTELSSTDKTEDIYQKLQDFFIKNKRREIRKGTTLTGPHRDDLHFILNGRNAHLYASQGQQRTIALSMKLAETDLVNQIKGEHPLLLLDDVMSELDQKRQSALLNFIHGRTQTFITTTDLAGISWEIMKKPRIYHIAAGKVSEEG